MIMLLFFLFDIATAPQCPQTCSCSNTAIQCQNLFMVTFPTAPTVMANVTELYVYRIFFHLDIVKSNLLFWLQNIYITAIPNSVLRMAVIPTLIFMQIVGLKFSIQTNSNYISDC